MNSPKNKNPMICLCNGIRQSTIEAAIRHGATELDQIYDATTAGVGACGGSCRPYLKQMLDQFLKSGDFPIINLSGRSNKKS